MAKWNREILAGAAVNSITGSYKLLQSLAPLGGIHAKRAS